MKKSELLRSVSHMFFPYGHLLLMRAINQTALKNGVYGFLLEHSSSFGDSTFVVSEIGRCVEDIASSIQYHELGIQRSGISFLTGLFFLRMITELHEGSHCVTRRQYQELRLASMEYTKISLALIKKQSYILESSYVKDSLVSQIYSLMIMATTDTLRKISVLKQREKAPS